MGSNIVRRVRKEEKAVKAFLFLYPIKVYVHAVVYPALTPESKQFLTKVMHRRYRANGFRVYWLAFSKDQNRDVPDRKQIEDGLFSVEPEDQVLNAGITLAELINGQYADPRHIGNQLSDNTTKIVIGGFHQWDCVDKMAAYFWSAGLETIVDEDLTDVGLGRFLSIGRNKSSCRLLSPNELMEFELDRQETDIGMSNSLLEAARLARAEKPWFFQP